MTEMRACILSISGPALTPEERAFLSTATPWGVILMGRSCIGPDQVRALVDDVWSVLGRSCLVFTDQEGGRVRRLRPPNWPDFPAPARYARIYEADRDAGLEACWLGYRLIAAELAPIGIHANCAPVVDLLHPGAHVIVGDRSFGASPLQAAELARAALNGMSAGGVAGVIKHLPGHGRAHTDSHEALPTVRATADEMALDLNAFRPVADAPMGMTAHIAFPALDGDMPATLSRRIITETIRGDLGFDGLLISDDLGMKALGGALRDRAERATAAGCDIALHCAGFEKDPAAILAEMEAVAAGSPVLSGASLLRAEAAERATLGGQPFDRREGWLRLEALLAAYPGAPGA